MSVCLINSCETPKSYCDGSIVSYGTPCIFVYVIFVAYYFKYSCLHIMFTQP